MFIKDDERAWQKPQSGPIFPWPASHCWTVLRGAPLWCVPNMPGGRSGRCCSSTARRSCHCRYPWPCSHWVASRCLSIFARHRHWYLEWNLYRYITKDINVCKISMQSTIRYIVVYRVRCYTHYARYKGYYADISVVNSNISTSNSEFYGLCE